MTFSNDDVALSLLTLSIYLYIYRNM